MDWELGERADKPVNEIARAVKSADAVYLASDPDREGEAIAWHVLEVLRAKGLAKSATIKRVTFNEITKKTVTDAIAHPREIDQDLVDAYMARRALDYLVGFSLSPVLWRKLPGAKSAGRVQSVALRLICERESEIEKFKTQEFWTIEATFLTSTKLNVPAHLTHLNGKKLDKFALQTKPMRKPPYRLLNQLSYKVGTVEKKQTKRNPYPPFTTSTLATGSLAQARHGRNAHDAHGAAPLRRRGYRRRDRRPYHLYAYRRRGFVDGGHMAARDVIAQDFGASFVPESPRIYKATAKNAQEAHEAIRPTDLRRRPEQVARTLDKEHLALYTLVWQRTMASQMASAVLDQVSVDIAGSDNKAVFRATGSVVVFDGWLKVYQESEDDDKKPDDDGYGNVRLPPNEGAGPLAKKEIKPEQHFTQPPPRYSEASLVKRLEELGIGRPSTYASIMQVLQDRDYVRSRKNASFPKTGAASSRRSSKTFSRNMSNTTSRPISKPARRNFRPDALPWKKVLREFWTGFSGAIGDTNGSENIRRHRRARQRPWPAFLPSSRRRQRSASLHALRDGTHGIKARQIRRIPRMLELSRTCRNTRPLSVAGGDEAQSQMAAGPRDLGFDPATGLPVTSRVGPYGAYVQLGPAPVPAAAPEETPADGKKKKKKRKKQTRQNPNVFRCPKAWTRI
jgi:DNA topoisomerase-1